MDQFLKFVSQPGFMVPIMVIVIVLKGTALWKAASRKQLFWFVIMSIFNSVGILEILYIFWLNRYELGDNKKILAFLDEKIGKKLKIP